MVLYEMWALPEWAVQVYTPEGKPAIDAWGKPVKRAAKPDVYARIVVDFCKSAKERSGAAPEIIGIQNEVEQPPEVFAEMTTAVRKALDAAGLRRRRFRWRMRRMCGLRFVAWMMRRSFRRSGARRIMCGAPVRLPGVSGESGYV